jgi:hypothetical protein
MNVLDGLAHALSGVTGGISIAQLDGFVPTGGRAGRNLGAGGGPVGEFRLDHHGRSASRIQDLERP